MPSERRWSQTAWVVARIWVSLKLSLNDEPRWPEVPKETGAKA